MNQLRVQMSWGNGGCARAGFPGDQQTREFGPWAARRSRAMMRAKTWGHGELICLGAVTKLSDTRCAQIIIKSIYDIAGIILFNNLPEIPFWFYR